MNNRRNSQKLSPGKKILAILLYALLAFSLTGVLSDRTSAGTPEGTASSVYTLHYRCEYASQYEPDGYPGEQTFYLYKNGEKTDQAVTLTADESQSTETVTKTLDIADYDAQASYSLKPAATPDSWKETVSDSGNQTDVVLSYQYTIIVTKLFVYPEEPAMAPKRNDRKNNSDNKRGVLRRTPSNPTSVTVKLWSSDGTLLRTLTLKKSENYSSRLVLSTDEMSRFDHVTEEGADGWTMHWSMGRKLDPGTHRYCYTIDLVNEVSTMTFTVNKKWDDNRHGRRPDSITLNLYQDGELYDTKTVDAEKSASEQSIYFKNVPVGHEYYVREKSVDGYSTEYGTVTSSTGNMQQTVINHFVGYKARFIIKKNWLDDQKTPVWITVYDAETRQPVRDASGNVVRGRATFNSSWNRVMLDIYNLDPSRSYYAVEDNVAGYTPVYSEVSRSFNSDGSIILYQTITNIPDNLPLELRLYKNYEGLGSGDSLSSYKPKEIRIRVYEEGHPDDASTFRMTADSSGNLCAIIEENELPQGFDPAKKNYVFEEETLTGWKLLSQNRQWAVENGKVVYRVTFTNYPVSSLTVRKKVTEGGEKLPEDSTLKDAATRFRVILHNNMLSSLGSSPISGTYGDITFSNGVAIFSLKDGESRTASGLPAGTTYTVEELDASDCTVSANLSYPDLSGKARSRTVSTGRLSDKTLFNTNQIVTVTNDYPTASLEASVVWKDSGNEDGVRPDADSYNKWIRIYRQVGSGKLEDITEDAGSHLTAANGSDSDTYRITVTGLPKVLWSSDKNSLEPITYYLEQVQPATAGQKYLTAYTDASGADIKAAKLSGTDGFIGTITNTLQGTRKADREPASPDNGGKPASKGPRTGDASPLFFWLAAMATAGGLLIAGQRRISKSR